MSDDRGFIEEPTGGMAGDDPIFPDNEPEQRAPRAPVTVRGVAIVGARVVTGAIGIGVAIATITAATLLPLPTLGTTPVGVLVTPVPTAQQLVCPGALLRLADDTGQGATVSSSLGNPATTFAAGGGRATSTAIETSDAGTGGATAAPAVISTPPDDVDPTALLLLSGGQVQSVAEGEFVGLAAAACTPVSGESWLAAGATTVGRTTLITLTNPTEVAATVDLTIVGESGPIAAPGTSGITVAPNGQRVLSLAGFAPDVTSPVVLVTSTGGQVAAALQQSIVRGLDAGGLDIVGPTGAPSLVNVIPGVVISGAGRVQELLGGGDDFEDLRSILRLYAPGEGSVAATVSVVPADGAGTGTSFAFALDAGRVSDVPFDELPDGSYTVVVETDRPTIAGVRVSAADEESVDLAWLSAAPALTESALVSIADGENPLLHLANATDAEATVTVDGEPVVIPAGASVALSVEPGETVRLDGAEGIHAAVSINPSGALGRYPALPASEGATTIRIYP